jgi:Mor family transcriptional regulator
MENITNYDIFESLFHFIKNSNDINEVIKEYGGGVIYIPSYKTTLRNEDILREYQENIKHTGIVKKLSRKYGITERQIYTLTKDLRGNKKN